MKSLFNLSALIILFFCFIAASYDTLNAAVVTKEIKNEPPKETSNAEKNGKKGNLFTDSELVFEHVNSEGMSYVLVYPKDSDPEEELPVIVFLHGFPGTGEDLDGLEGRELFLKMLRKKSKELGRTFNGYIIFPQTSDPNWQDKEEDIREIVEDFSQIHKIDRKNIVIAGFSMGAAGVCVLATMKNSDGTAYFSRALVVSASTSDKSVLRELKRLHIPIYGIEAFNEHRTGEMLKRLAKTNEVKYNQAGESHGLVGKYVFSTDTSNGGFDADNNNQSDVIEWLFPDYNF